MSKTQQTPQIQKQMKNEEAKAHAKVVASLSKLSVSPQLPHQSQFSTQIQKQTEEPHEVSAQVQQFLKTDEVERASRKRKTPAQDILLEVLDDDELALALETNTPSSAPERPLTSQEREELFITQVKLEKIIQSAGLIRRGVTFNPSYLLDKCSRVPQIIYMKRRKLKREIMHLEALQSHEAQLKALVIIDETLAADDRRRKKRYKHRRALDAYETDMSSWIGESEGDYGEDEEYLPEEYTTEEASTGSTDHY